MFAGVGRGAVPNSTAQLVEALRYRPEGRGFDFSGVTGSFR
jgi:hypothetical protein